MGFLKRMTILFILSIIQSMVFVTIFPMDNGETLLHKAARAGDLVEVTRLLNDRAGANIRDNNGHTPLYYAAAAGHLPIVNLFLIRVSNIVIDEAILADAHESVRPLLAMFRRGRETIGAVIEIDRAQARANRKRQLECSIQDGPLQDEVNLHRVCVACTYSDAEIAQSTEPVMAVSRPPIAQAPNITGEEIQDLSPDQLIVELFGLSAIS